MPHNDLYFRVADATFRVHLTDINDARPMLPSYAPFHQPDGCGEEELLFTMTVSDGAVPFVGRGTELGRFDCGDIVHNVFRTDDETWRAAGAALWTADRSFAAARPRCMTAPTPAPRRWPSAWATP